MRSYFTGQSREMAGMPGMADMADTIWSGIRSRLKEFQIDPIKLERFLQRRTSAPEKGQESLIRKIIPWAKRWPE